MYLAGPEEEAEELPLGSPHESEDVAGAEGFGGLAGVGFDTPAEVFAAPGGEAVAAGGVPDEFKGAEQGCIQKEDISAGEGGCAVTGRCRQTGDPESSQEHESSLVERARLQLIASSANADCLWDAELRWSESSFERLIVKRLRLLGVLAHPDDESLGFCGSLAKYAAEGVETFLVTATRGEAGRFGAAGTGQ